MKSSVFLILLAAMASSASACADTGDSLESAAVVRDSADVAIVENTPPDESTPLWTVDSVPAVDIGMLEGPPEYQLEALSGAARLSDGTIVVADGGGHVIRFYDATGRHIRSVGRDGAGPGEFQGLGQTFVDESDTVRAWDYRLRRLTVLAPSGEFVRTVMLAPPAGVDFGLQPISTLGGALVTTTTRSVRPGTRPGLVRDTTMFYLHDNDGSITDSLGPWPQHESFIIADDNRVTVTGRAFGRRTSIQGHGDLLYVADNDRWQIEVHDTAGLRRLIRMPFEHRPVTAADIDELKRQRLENIDDRWRPTTERLLSEMSYPETMPAFGSIRVDDDGQLWVADYVPDHEEGTGAWTVFDAEGRLIARARVPAGLRVGQIWSDWLLGIWHDELDVPHVRVHRLTRVDAAE